MEELIIFIKKNPLFKSLDYFGMNLLLDSEEKSDKSDYFVVILDLILKCSSNLLKIEHYQYLVKVFPLSIFADAFKNYNQAFKIRFLLEKLFMNLYLVSYENIIDCERKVRKRDDQAKKMLNFSKSQSSDLINQKEFFGESFWVIIII